jgi:hypothetical protein
MRLLGLGMGIIMSKSWYDIKSLNSLVLLLYCALERISDIMGSKPSRILMDVCSSQELSMSVNYNKNR